MSNTKSPTGPGVALIIVATLAAFGLHYLPFVPFLVRQGTDVRRPISPEIIAILIGIALRNLIPLPLTIGVTARWVVRNILPATVVFIGAGLDLMAVKQIGLSAFGVVVLCIIASATATYIIGGWFGLTPRTSLLIGAGTAICGNSAIIAVAPLVEADDRDIVLSLGTINLFGLVAMVVLPIIGGFLKWNDQAFGVLAGVAVHSIPQSMAAGYAYSAAAGGVATLTKLVRVTMLTPMVLVMALVYAQRHRGEAGVEQKTTIHIGKLIPWYIWGFLAVTIINTLHLFPTISVDPNGWIASIWGNATIPFAKLLSEIGKWLLTISMVAIGLEVDLPALARVGGKAVVVGGLATVVVIGAAVGFVAMLLPVH